MNKLNFIIGQLEEIRNLSDPDIDVVRKQVDDFEYEILPKLDEEFDELRSRIYDEGDPDEAAEKLMDQIGDQFIQADALINTIREQFEVFTLPFIAFFRRPYLRGEHLGALVLHSSVSIAWNTFASATIPLYEQFIELSVLHRIEREDALPIAVAERTKAVVF